MKTMKEYLSTPEGVRQMWDKINEVLDNFNFDNVEVVMEALDWSWHCSEAQAEEYGDEGCKVKRHNTLIEGQYEYFPKYKHLLKAARERIVGCIESMPEDRTTWSESAGGFMARVSICTDEERRDYYGNVADVDDFEHSVDIALYFIAEESTSY